MTSNRIRRKGAIAGLILLAVSITGVFSIASEQTDKSKTRQQIVEAHIGEHDLYIPLVYAMSIGDESGLLRAYYPGGAPIIGAENAIWREGRSRYFIRILFTDLGQIPAFNPEKGLQEAVRLFKASKVVGMQYGLIYQTQPESINNDWDELWIERQNDTLISYISCRKAYAEGVVPHCSHRFHDDQFSYKVSFDKRLLPEWGTLRINVLALINSFQSEASARAFLADQISKAIPIQAGAHQ